MYLIFNCQLLIPSSSYGVYGSCLSWVDHHCIFWCCWWRFGCFPLSVWDLATLSADCFPASCEAALSQTLQRALWASHALVPWSLAVGKIHGLKQIEVDWTHRGVCKTNQNSHLWPYFEGCARYSHEWCGLLSIFCWWLSRPVNVLFSRVRNGERLHTPLFFGVGLVVGMGVLTQVFPNFA